MNGQMKSSWMAGIALLLQQPLCAAGGQAEILFTAPGAQPQPAISSGGRIHLVYGHGEEILWSQSESAHHPEFSEPTPISSLPELALGNHRGPRVDAAFGALAVTAQSADVYSYTYSEDERFWRRAGPLNGIGASAREGLHGLGSGPSGRLAAAWLDLRSGSMELWGAFSEDGGRTWGADQRIYASPEGSICTCCHPSVAWNSQGQAAILWRNDLAGARDLWMRVRQADGTWRDPQRVGEGSWKMNSCPMDGGAVVARANGKFAAVWRREGAIFLGDAEGREQYVAEGRNPGLLRHGESLRVVYQAGSDVHLWDESSGRSIVVAQGSFPSAVPLPDGGTLVAFQRDREGTPEVALIALRLP